MKKEKKSIIQFTIFGTCFSFAALLFLLELIWHQRQIPEYSIAKEIFINGGFVSIFGWSLILFCLIYTLVLLVVPSLSQRVIDSFFSVNWCIYVLFIFCNCVGGLIGITSTLATSYGGPFLHVMFLDTSIVILSFLIGSGIILLCSFIIVLKTRKIPKFNFYRIISSIIIMADLCVLVFFVLYERAIRSNIWN